MMPTRPDAFLSYTRFDNRKGEISTFRQELSDVVRAVSGEPFDIFQDVDDETGIGLGQKWKDALDNMLDQARFFIPILTPSFFKSQPCRDELSKFLKLEKKAGRQDLVLPIYWITCPVLEEGHLKASDELAQTIDERQRWDWRKLRHRSFADTEVAEQLDILGTQIERARQNVLRAIETPKEAVDGQRAESLPPTLEADAAQEMVRHLVEQSKHGLKFDPQLRVDYIRDALQMPAIDVREAFEELNGKNLVFDGRGTMAQRPFGFLSLCPEERLFALFDQKFMAWNPQDDACHLATDLLSRYEGELPIKIEASPGELGEYYRWPPRRLNPALAYLELNGVARLERAHNTGPFSCFQADFDTMKARVFIRGYT